MSERPATMPVDAERLAVVDGLIESLDATALVWVSGYLAGAARVQPTGTPGHAVDVRAEPLVRATILYASQTGNGRRLAERFARGAEASGLAVQVVSAADYAPRDLARERLLFVIASTHGDGDPPDDARPMMDFLSAKRAPRLEQLGFAVLALGDSSYPTSTMSLPRLLGSSGRPTPCASNSRNSVRHVCRLSPLTRIRQTPRHASGPSCSKCWSISA